jgi:hypothetical protein
MCICREIPRAKEHSIHTVNGDIIVHSMDICVDSL